MLKVTRQTDPELANLVDEELSRQEHNIEMIASESTAPLAVMELTGSVFTNKTLVSRSIRFDSVTYNGCKMLVI